MLGMDLARINCLRMAFSSSIRFFSSGSLVLIFLFSSSIHLKSSLCCCSGMGSCTRVTGATGRLSTVALVVGDGVGTEVEVGAASVVSSSRAISFFFVLVNR